MYVVFFCHSFKRIWFSFLFIAANVKVPSKAQLNKRSGTGETLLHKACRKDDLAQVRVLIQAGISINMEDYAGSSQFVCALCLSYAGALYLRLKRIYCLTLNRPNSRCWLELSGWTALHEASVVGDAAVVTELLKAGANVNARSCDGITPLHDAVVCGHYQVISLLRSHKVELNNTFQILKWVFFLFILFFTWIKWSKSIKGGWFKGPICKIC